MPYTKNSHHTPHFIAFLIYLQIGFTGAWMIARILFPHFSFLYFQHFFGLTLYGVKHFFLWQYITYFLTEPIYPQALIGEAFLYAIKLYMFWIGATIVFERKFQRSFLTFYLSVGIMGGIVTALSLLYWTSPYPFMNNFGIIIALFVAAMMLSRDARIYLFNAFPMQLKTLVLIILIFALFQNFSNGNIPNCSNIIATTILSYLYCVIGWKCVGPFHQLHDFEKKLHALFRRKR